MMAMVMFDDDGDYFTSLLEIVLLTEEIPILKILWGPELCKFIFHMTAAILMAKHHKSCRN